MPTMDEMRACCLNREGVRNWFNKNFPHEESFQRVIIRGDEE